MALQEVVDEDHDSGWLLEWVHGFAELDRRIFFLLLEADEKRTVDEIAAEVDRDRSTTYRALRRLDDRGYLEREQRTYENGGYCYRYGAVEPDTIARELEETIATCQERLDALLAEFRQSYCEGAGDQKSGKSSGASYSDSQSMYSAFSTSQTVCPSSVSEALIVETAPQESSPGW